MRKKPDLSTTRNRRRAGSARIVEIALYIMPTFATIFGFLDIGMILFTWNTMQNAVREGVRYAITYQTTNASTAHRQSIKNQTAQWMLGWVNATSTVTSTGTPPPPYVEVKFYKMSAGGTISEETGSTGNQPGNIVEVAIRRYPYRYMAPFSGSFNNPFYATPGSSLTLQAFGSDVMGGMPGSTPPAVD